MRAYEARKITRAVCEETASASTTNRTVQSATGQMLRERQWPKAEFVGET